MVKIPARIPSKLLFTIILCNLLLVLVLGSYVGAQGDATEELQMGTVVFLKTAYNNLEQGQPVTVLFYEGNGRYLTDYGTIDRSLLESKDDTKQQSSLSVANATRDEFNLVLNNIEGCTIEFSSPHEQLIYVNNMLLQKGEYDVSVSKRLYFPVSLHIPMNQDVIYDVELKSIFTNYGGGHIDEFINKGEISLDDEFEGKTLLHQLIENFSKEYPSIVYSAGWPRYKDLPEGAPTVDLLNSITYFIHKGFNINKPDSTGKNLLTNVINLAPTEVLNLLFQKGAKVQSEFINESNSYLQIFKFVGGYELKWVEKVVPLFPEDLLTELLNREVGKFFTIKDAGLVKYLVEGVFCLSRNWRIIPVELVG